LVIERVVPRRRLMRLAPQAAAAAIVALAIVAPFARHYGVLAAVDPAEAASGAANLAAYLVPPENTFAGQWLIAHGVKGPRWIWGEQTVYLGWVALGFAIVGAWRAVRGSSEAARRGRVFIVLGLAAVALAAGPTASEVGMNAWSWSPFGFVARVPGVNLFRVPARFTELTTLAVAMLAALGCAAIHARLGTIGRIATVAAMPLFLAESFVVNFPGGLPPPFPIPPVYSFIATVPGGAVVSLPD